MHDSISKTSENYQNRHQAQATLNEDYAMNSGFYVKDDAGL